MHLRYKKSRDISKENKVASYISHVQYYLNHNRLETLYRVEKEKPNFHIYVQLLYSNEC